MAVLRVPKQQWLRWVVTIELGCCVADGGDDGDVSDDDNSNDHADCDEDNDADDSGDDGAGCGDDDGKDADDEKDSGCQQQWCLHLAVTIASTTLPITKDPRVYAASELRTWSYVAVLLRSPIPPKRIE